MELLLPLGNMKQREYTFETSIDVRDYEIDVQGIVNNAQYLHYMEHTRHLFCQHVGYSFKQMHEHGCDPVLSRAEVDYISSLHSGDVMRSCLNISRQGPRYVFHQDIYNQDGKPVVRAKIYIAVLHDGRLTRGEELMEAFGPYLRNDLD